MNLPKLLPSAALSLFALALAGCHASGGNPPYGPGEFLSGSGAVDSNDGTGDDTADNGNTQTSFPNDGTAGGGTVLEGTTPIAGTGTDRNFLCTDSAQIFAGASTVVGANGLVGGQLTDLVNGLGGTSTTALLNSVRDKDLAIDGTLRTASVFTLSVSLLATAVDSLDQHVVLPNSLGAGNYAVFGVSFPAGLLNLGVLTEVRVTTFLGETLQEDAVVLDATALDLLGVGISGPVYAYVGRKVTKSYDRAVISLQAAALAADVSEAMYVHELCTGGDLVPLPAT